MIISIQWYRTDVSSKRKRKRRVICIRFGHSLWSAIGCQRNGLIKNVYLKYYSMLFKNIIFFLNTVHSWWRFIKTMGVIIYTFLRILSSILRENLSCDIESNHSRSQIRRWKSVIIKVKKKKNFVKISKIISFEKRYVFTYLRLFHLRLSDATVFVLRYLLAIFR